MTATRKMQQLDDVVQNGPPEQPPAGLTPMQKIKWQKENQRADAGATPVGPPPPRAYSQRVWRAPQAMQHSGNVFSRARRWRCQRCSLPPV